MATSRIYRSSLVKNKNKHHLAKDEYFLVYIEGVEGRTYPALFTINEMQNAMDRAWKNPEDAPNEKPSIWNKLFKFFGICE